MSISNNIYFNIYMYIVLSYNKYNVSAFCVSRFSFMMITCSYYRIILYRTRYLIRWTYSFINFNFYASKTYIFIMDIFIYQYLFQIVNVCAAVAAAAAGDYDDDNDEWHAYFIN